MSVDRTARAVADRLPRRAVGLKLPRVCVMAGVMSAPALFAFPRLSDRAHRAEQAASKISAVVGATTSFAAIAAVMYFTRRIGWYGSRDPAAEPGIKESVPWSN